MGSDGHFVPIFALPILSGPSGHLPLIRGVVPLDPHFTRGRQLGRPGGQRKGAGDSADWLPFYHRWR